MASDASSCAETVATASPASRTASLSPTQRMTLEAGRKRRFGLGPDVGVGLALRLAPLAMADDGQPRAGVEQHRRRDAAGMGALVGLVHILAADREARRGANGPLDQCRRKAERDVRAAVSAAIDIAVTSPRSAASPCIFQLPATSLRRAINRPFSLLAVTKCGP